MAIQGNEAPKAICIARLQGCIKSMADLIGMELRNFSTLAELRGLVGAQGDKIIVCPPTLSLYEVVAIQTFQNDHRILYVIESELELVKLASIVVAYVVHKAILSESKTFSVLASCGKFKTMMRLMCYVAHLGGHRCVEEFTVAQQVLKSNPVFKVFNNFDAIQSKFSSHNGIFVEIQFAKLRKTYGIIDAHDTPSIEKVMKIVGLSKAQQVTIFKILASVMMLSNIDLAKGNEIVSSILHVHNTWFHLCITIEALYTHSSLERLNIILSVWLHSNLQGKVLIGEGSIVMNAPKSVMAILSEGKSFSILASCGKFKTMMRLMCYVAHLRGHRCVEECTVAQQLLKSDPIFKALNNVDAIQRKFSSHNGITDAYDSSNIEKVMKIVGLSKAEQVTIFKILASVMMLSNIDLAKGNEIVSSILHVDNIWFHLCTTIAALYTHSSLERLNIILSVWLHSNLEGNVLIGEGSIVMNGPKSVMINTSPLGDEDSISIATVMQRFRDELLES
ncbi:hypothetical protein BC332_17228 [Capsicum chinense]|nr:hypothetical protein BC332_17228 [Capsicum chinense]